MVPTPIGGGLRPVLSIGKLGRGQEGYYLQAVARGVEDYYLGSGEAPGRWIGSGCSPLGLAGQVRAEALTAVLDARRPGKTAGKDDGTGRPGVSLIMGRRQDRLPGFDLTFSAPKGVSLLFALGDPQLSLTVRAAHDAAVVAALRYLEREAGEVRRGRDGLVRLPGGGFVAAAFRHRTSRAGDPQLHTHVLVANIAQGPDGRWTALDGRQLYAQAKTAGTLYQAVLRHELRPLGLSWEVRDNGLGELTDIPTRVLRAFSRRRVEIEAAMAQAGTSSRVGAQIATLATRKAKDYGVQPESLAAGWHARACELGFDAGSLRRLLGRQQPRDLDGAEQVRAAAELLSPDGLTQRSATFTRADTLRGWCLRLVHGATVEQVEALADRLLTATDVIPLDRPARPEATAAPARAERGGAARSFARHTTREMLATEQAVLTTALAARDTGAGLGLQTPDARSRPRPVTLPTPLPAALPVRPATSRRPVPRTARPPSTQAAPPDSPSRCQPSRRRWSVAW